MTNELSIVITVNAKYIKYLYVFCMSLFQTNDGKKIHLFLLEPDFTDENKIFVQDYIEKYGAKVSFIDVSPEILEPYKEYLSERFSDMVYYRLILADLLPKELDQVLLLDVDIVVKKDLSPWFGIDLQKYLFVAAIDMVMPQIPSDKLAAYHRKPEGEIRYFNGGVVLWNLKQIRAEFKPGQFLEEGLSPEIPKEYNEQDILNALCGDRVLYLDPIEVNPIIKQCEKWFGKKDYREILEDKSLLWHYAGDNPWRSTRKAQCYDAWWEYAKKSPFYLEILEDTQSNLEDNYEAAMERSARMYQLILKLNEENARLTDK